MLEAAGELCDALGFDDDGARGEGALDAGADGFGTGEGGELRGLVGFEQSDAAQSDLCVRIGDLMQPIGNGHGKRVRGDGFEKGVNIGVADVLVEGATNFFGIETIETTIDARAGECCGVFSIRGQLPEVIGVGVRGGDEVGKSVLFFGMGPAQGFGAMRNGIERERCIVKERDAEGCDFQRVGAQVDGIKFLKQFEMGANEIGGRVSGIVAFKWDELFRACGIAIEFQERSEFDILFGRHVTQYEDEPLRERLRCAEGMVGHFKEPPLFALGAGGFGWKGGVKEKLSLLENILSKVRRDPKCWHKLAL